MGKFDGILLCSDFDMTLAQNEIISPENAAAIRYFTENGGKFTIVSGRHPGFLCIIGELLTLQYPLTYPHLLASYLLMPHRMRFLILVLVQSTLHSLLSVYALARTAGTRP